MFFLIDYVNHILKENSPKAWFSLTRECIITEEKTSNFHKNITPVIIPASFGVVYFGRKLVDNGDYRKIKLFFHLRTV